MKKNEKEKKRKQQKISSKVAKATAKQESSKNSSRAAKAEINSSKATKAAAQKQKHQQTSKSTKNSSENYKTAPKKQRNKNSSKSSGKEAKSKSNSKPVEWVPREAQTQKEWRAQTVGGPEGGGLKRVGPEVEAQTWKKWEAQMEGGPEGWGPEGGGPKISRFFSLSGSHFRSFCLSQGVFSLNFGGVFVGRDPQMCTFGLSGCRVKPRGGPAEEGSGAGGPGRWRVQRKGGPAVGGPAHGGSGGGNEKKNQKMFDECVLGVRANVFTTNELQRKRLPRGTIKSVNNR